MILKSFLIKSFGLICVFCKTLKCILLNNINKLRKKMHKISLKIVFYFFYHKNIVYLVICKVTKNYFTNLKFYNTLQQSKVILICIDVIYKIFSSLF